MRREAGDDWRAIEATARSQSGFGGDPVQLQVRRADGERTLSLSLSSDAVRAVDDGPYGAEVVISLELCDLLAE